MRRAHETRIRHPLHRQRPGATGLSGASSGSRSGPIGGIAAPNPVLHRVLGHAPITASPRPAVRGTPARAKSRPGAIVTSPPVQVLPARSPGRRSPRAAALPPNPTSRAPRSAITAPTSRAASRPRSTRTRRGSGRPPLSSGRAPRTAARDAVFRRRW